MHIHKWPRERGRYLTKSTPDWWAVEEPCDILQLQDKKTYFRSLSQLSRAGMLCGNPRRALSLLSPVQGRSDGCGVFMEEVLHGTWMLPEAIGDISLENPVLRHQTCGQCVLSMHMVQCGFLACPVPERWQRQWEGGVKENIWAHEWDAHIRQSGHRTMGFVHAQEPSTDNANTLQRQFSEL